MPGKIFIFPQNVCFSSIFSTGDDVIELLCWMKMCHHFASKLSPGSNIFPKERGTPPPQDGDQRTILPQPAFFFSADTRGKNPRMIVNETIQTTDCLKRKKIAGYLILQTI